MEEAHRGLIGSLFFHVFSRFEAQSANRNRVRPTIAEHPVTASKHRRRRNVQQQNSMNGWKLIDGTTAIVRTKIFWFQFARNFAKTLTILFISNLHTSAYQISKKDSDKAKFLFHQQMSLITTAVKLASLQTSGELILNVQDHLPNTSLTALVTRLVRKELKNINKILLGGVTIYNTIGKLAALSDAIWFWDSVKAHLQEHCLDVHNVYIIGRH